MSFELNRPWGPRGVRSHRTVLTAILACAALFCVSAQFAPVGAQQAATATLRGTIIDPHGAVVSGARVVATQKDTGISRETSSNADGLYVFSNLPPGSYEIRIQAAGFTNRVSSTPVTLQVGQSVTLDAYLEIGSIGETVDLVGEIPLVDTSNSVVSGVVDQLEIQSLPLNGRNFLELALLIPGNSPAPNFDPTKTNTVVISSAGQLGRGGNVTVDGADNNDDVVGGSVQNISQEAVQEFQIATNRFSSELGRSGSSVINVVTKSGNNEYHGSDSFYFRDRALQGLPATFDRTLGETAPFDREQYAFALGGPISKNRAWFFGSFEYRNQDGAVLVGARDLASRSIRKGFATAPLNDLLSTERIDWQPTALDHLTLRYSLQREDDIAPSSLIRAIGSASERQASTNNTHSIFANYTRLLSPTAVNNFNFSFSRFYNNIEPVTIGPQLTLNLGLRYEIDTDVKNISRTNQLNPLILPFLHGTRGKDANNFGPRVGLNYATKDGKTSFHAGYGIYYDRITLEIQSLERGLDGRALPIDVRAGNLFFLDPQFLFDPVNGVFPPGAPTLANPFTGFILPGAGAGGINIIDNGIQNPIVQQTNVGVQREFGRTVVVRADYLHNFGTHFIIGRAIGQVFNPVVGGPDVVKNLESSVRTKYDGLLFSLEKRFSHRSQFRASYTFSRSFNFANDDQIPFSNGPINPNNLQLEYGPTPNDQRHRFTFSGVFDLPYGVQLSPIVTIASGVPMDILVPDGSQRIPQLQRNAGGRLFHSGAELKTLIKQLHARGGFCGQPLPLVSDTAQFSDSFNSFDLRVARPFKVGERVTIQPIAEVFNLFNVTNVLGVSNANYSGFNNVLVRDSNDPASAAFLRSSSFGQPVTTAGGVFGSGGPRAFQFAVRVSF